MDFDFLLHNFPHIHVRQLTLFMLLWDGVLKMMEAGFHIYWCILDGAEVNQQFIKLHFYGENEAMEKNFTAHNIYTGEFMMDCKVSIMFPVALFVPFMQYNITFWYILAAQTKHMKSSNGNTFVI